MPHDETRAHYGLTFAVLALGALSFSLLQSLVAPALPEIQRELGASTEGVAWVMTAYLLSASVVTPIAGRLGDMFGKKRVLVVMLVLLAAGAAVAALAGSIELMIAGRVLQGFGGAVFPLAFGIIRDEFPRERVATGIALISGIFGIGGGLGIMLAGPIVSGLSYHWLFWLPLVVIVAAVVIAELVVPESPVRTPGKVNWLGATLLSGSLVALLYAVTKASDWGWGSGRFLGLVVLAVALAAAWVGSDLRAAEPLVDMRMMRERPVWTTNVAALLLGAGMYSSFVLLPEFVEMPKSTGFGFGASVTAAGLFMLPSTAAMLLCSPLSARVTNAFGAKVPLVAGTVLTGVSFLMLTVEHSERWEIYVASFVMGAGIGLSYAALANLIVAAVSPSQTGVATAMNTIMRTIGGAIGSQIAASVVAAHVAADGLPEEQGFTTAFAICTGALVVSALAALIVPGRPRRGMPTELVPEGAAGR